MSEVKIAPIPDLGQRTDEITIYAGPCSVESAEQFEEVACTGFAAARSSRALTRILSKVSAKRP